MSANAAAEGLRVDRTSTRTMRAVVIEEYGPPNVLKLADIPIAEPGEGQLRIRVEAAAVNPIDCRIRDGALRLIMRQRFPLVLGYDVAGEVDAIGRGVVGFQRGDPVYSRTRSAGGYAEYAVTEADLVAPMPERLSFTEAASLPLVSLTALQAFRRAGVGTGHRVLVNGASGGVGTAAVQIGRALGAEVTAVCSDRNAELVSELGATDVIDYGAEDFTLGSDRYDMVFDVVANRTYGACRRVLTERGVYLTLYPSLASALWSLVAVFSRRRALFMDTKPSGSDLRTVSELVRDGALRPVIDSVLPLEQAAEAHVRSESRHARGKIVLALESSRGLEGRRPA